MIKKTLIAILFLVSPLMAQTGGITGYCEKGATKAVTSGLNSTNYLQGVIPTCTVTVYDTGTVNKSTIYADSINTPLANPFTATVSGQWIFFASVTKSYDVVLSGGTPPNTYSSPVTLVDLAASANSANFCLISGCTFTGPISATAYNGVLEADRYPGATADIKLNACIAAVISAGGGECDARGLGGSQVIAAQVSVGNHSQVPVLLRLPQYGLWSVTDTNASDCAFEIFGNSSIIGTAPGGSSQMIIKANSIATSIDSLLCTEASPSGGGQYVLATGFLLYNSVGATFGTAAINWRYTYDNSKLENVTIADYTNTGLKIYGACCDTTFTNVTVNGNGTSGGPAVWIFSDSSAINHDISFFSLSADHAGKGNQNILISGLGAGSATDSTNRGIDFFNLYSEFTASASVASIGLQITDARNVNVYGATVGVIGGFSSSTGISISQTYAHQVRGISIYGYNYEQASGSTGLYNGINSETYLSSTGYLSRYHYGDLGGSQPDLPLTDSGDEHDWKDASNNIIYYWPIPSVATPIIANHADATFQLSLAAGKTTGEIMNLSFYDQTTEAWRFTKGTTNFFTLKGVSANTNRLVFDPGTNGNSSIDANGSGYAYVNGDGGSGTGGFRVYSGGASPSLWFQIDGANGGKTVIPTLTPVPGTSGGYFVCVNKFNQLFSSIAACSGT